MCINIDSFGFFVVAIGLLITGYFVTPIIVGFIATLFGRNPDDWI